MKTDNPRPMVSVIMPVYNSERFIRKTIECILNQTYKDFELILIVDCPTDNTVEVIEAIDDERIVKLFNEKNSGIAFGRNRGIKNARGKYIAIMDNDDLCTLDRFEKSVDYLERHPEVGVVGGGVVPIDEDDKPIWSPTVVIGNPKEVWADVLFQCPLPNSSTMIRKSVIDELNLKYHDNMLGMEDYRFWMEISSHTLIYNFEDIFLQWRISQGAETTRVLNEKEQERARKFSQIQMIGLNDRKVKLTEEEYKLFFHVYNENRNYKDYDIKKTYDLTRKILGQVTANYPDMSEETLYVFRNRFLQAAMRIDKKFGVALDEVGFGGIIKQDNIPLVSIVVAANSDSQHLDKFFESLSKQTYKKYEILIVCDDRTKDSCVVEKGIRSAGDIPIKIIEVSGSLARKYNKAIENAEGEYITFGEARTEWHPDKLEIQVYKMMQNPCDDVVFGKSTYYNEEQLIEIVEENYDWERRKKDYLDEVIQGRHIGLSTVMVKRDAFRNIGGFMEGDTGLFGWDFAINCATNLTVDFIPTPISDELREIHHELDCLQYVREWCHIIRKFYAKHKQNREKYINNAFKVLRLILPNITDEERETATEIVINELVPDVLFDGMVACLFFSEYNVYRVNEEKSNLEQANATIDKLSRYKRTAIKLMNPEKEIAEWLLAKRYSRVAIYGVGRLGKCLLDRLANTDIQVVALIDKNKGDYQGVPVVGMEGVSQFEHQIDVIIVTPLYEVNRIEQQIRRELDCEIISVENLLE